MNSEVLNPYFYLRTRHYSAERCLKKWLWQPGFPRRPVTSPVSSAELTVWSKGFAARYSLLPLARMPLE